VKERKEVPMATSASAEWTFEATIPARDIDSTRKFYEGILSLEILRETPAGITYRTGDTSLSLYPTQFAGTAQHTLGGFVVKDIEAAVAELRQRGVTFEEYDMPGLKTVDGIAELEGERAAWFKDPEGNILSLYQTS
jgi:catechol 2,3-dioxygenase-like lactoylglutathione lyase family enzyme